MDNFLKKIQNEYGFGDRCIIDLKKELFPLFGLEDILKRNGTYVDYDYGGFIAGLKELFEAEIPQEPTVRKLYEEIIKGDIRFYEKRFATSLAVIFGTKSFKLSQDFFRDHLLEKGEFKLENVFTTERHWDLDRLLIDNFEEIPGAEFIPLKTSEEFGKEYYVLKEDVDKVLKCGFDGFERDHNLADLKDGITFDSEDEFGFRYFIRNEDELKYKKTNYGPLNCDKKFIHSEGLLPNIVLKSKLEIAKIDANYNFAKSPQDKEKNSSGYSNADTFNLLKRYAEGKEEFRVGTKIEFSLENSVETLSFGGYYAYQWNINDSWNDELDSSCYFTGIKGYIPKIKKYPAPKRIKDLVFNFISKYLQETTNVNELNRFVRIEEKDLRKSINSFIDTHYNPQNIIPSSMK